MMENQRRKETCYVYMLVNGSGRPLMVHSMDVMQNETDVINQMYYDLIESGEFEHWRPNQNRDYQISFFRMTQGQKGYEVHRFTSHLNWLIENEMSDKALFGFRDTAKGYLEEIHSQTYRLAVNIDHYKSESLAQK